jgi:hypothetical protein
MLFSAAELFKQGKILHFLSSEVNSHTRNRFANILVTRTTKRKLHEYSMVCIITMVIFLLTKVICQYALQLGHLLKNS